MSEQSSEAFGQGEAPVADGRRRAVMIGGIVAVVVALGVGAFVLLGSSPPAGGPPVALPTRPSATTLAPTPSLSAVPVPGAATEPNRYDPFKPLYTPKPVPTTAAPTPTASPTNPLPTTPGGTVGPGGPGVTPGTPTSGAPQNVVKLVSINGGGVTPTLTVLIDGVSATGKTGENLGGILQVVSIRPDDGAATLQLGDATFDLHIGQSYTN